MGIEDIQISEELETNAPSIKYSGSEGPKSPQEEMMMVRVQGHRCVIGQDRRPGDDR